MKTTRLRVLRYGVLLSSLAAAFLLLPPSAIAQQSGPTGQFLLPNGEVITAINGSVLGGGFIEEHGGSCVGPHLHGTHNGIGDPAEFGCGHGQLTPFFGPVDPPPSSPPGSSNGNFDAGHILGLTFDPGGPGGQSDFFPSGPGLILLQDAVHSSDAAHAPLPFPSGPFGSVGLPSGINLTLKR